MPAPEKISRSISCCNSNGY